MPYDKTRTQYPINIDMPAYELLREFAAAREISIPRAATELITRGIERKRADSKRHAGNGKPAKPGKIRRPAVDAGVWQCSGCHFVFKGPWREMCPECGRKDYWTGSVDPEGKPWPGMGFSQ